MLGGQEMCVCVIWYVGCVIHCVWHVCVRSVVPVGCDVYTVYSVCRCVWYERGAVGWRVCTCVLKLLSELQQNLVKTHAAGVF